MPKDLNQLGSLSLTNKLESLFTPKKKDEQLKPINLDDLINKSQGKLKKQLNVTPRLTGSLPLKLNLPNDADLDYFIPVHSQQKFNKLVKRLNKHPDFTPSQYNVTGAGYHVFTHKPTEHHPVPIDIAIATGPSAMAYKKELKQKTINASKIDAPTRNALLAKKHLLKHTPFDYKQKRYKAWKRELDAALGSSVRLKREPIPVKTAAILDLSDPEEQKKFLAYLERDDVYGHRSQHVDSLLEEQRLYSALEALKRGKLKSYEQGASVGTHENIVPARLSDSDIKLLEMELLKETPNTDIVSSMADKYKIDENTVKREFLKSRYPQIRRWLTQQKEPEQVRKEILSVPKLSPNIFATKGGLLDEPAYGNYGLLFQSRTAVPSPYLNLINREHIIPQRGTLTPRSIKLQRNYMVVPRDELRKLNRKNPNLRYIAAEDLPENVKERLLMPTRSLGEIPNRIIPNILSGNLNVRQTR
jgi:hypothetical protein